ncbi:MAG: TIGR03667 family PPOX class F420-dependent oxidoreductase [Thermoleophilia bacterium]
MAFQLDDSTPYGSRVARRLEVEAIAWLTTVGASGAPAPVPVWFLWDGASFLLYSRPGQPKLANIERSPRVTLHLESDGRGGDVVVVGGLARLAPGEPPADQVPAYVEKYAWGFQRIGMTAATFAATYSVPIRIEPRSLRGH